MAERALSRESVAIIRLSALAVFALALLSPAIFNDGDTYWHIRAGQWMLAHHAVLTRDPFSLSFYGRPWETQEWLAEIAFAGAFQVFSWSGVAILTGAAMATAAAMLATFLARRLDPVPCIVVLVLALGCVMPDFLARPHILALPFMTAWIIGLAQASETRREPRWILLLPMTIWANLHGSFIFGLALIVPFGIEGALRSPPPSPDAASQLRPTCTSTRRSLGEGGPCWGRKDSLRLTGKWLLFALAAVAATFLNPRGLTGFLFPFHLMQLKSLANIGEWQSPDFGALNPVELAFFATVFFLVWKEVRLSAIRLLLLLALAFLWLEHARYGMLLGITGAVLIADSVAASLKVRAATPTSGFNAKAALVAFGAAFLLLAALRITWPVKRADESAAALAAVPANIATLPVFNNYSFGGLLIFNGIKPLVDSRADLYGDAYLGLYARAINADEKVVDRLFQKYRVAWTILAPGDPLVAALDRRPGWHRLFTDRRAVVQVNRDLGEHWRRAVVSSARD
jgi:hypothetical protein